MTSKHWEEHALFAAQHCLADSPSGNFLKVDFHFHTPASGKDYRDRGVNYDDIAKRLTDENYDAVFVTDHNTGEGFRPLEAACRKAGNRTKVFPGIELTLATKAICLLSEGKKVSIVKFHCLALLPPSDDVENKIKSLITNNFTDNTILSEKPVARILKQPLEEVADRVRTWGGIFLPAHLNQGKDIEKTRSIDDLYEDSITVEYLKKYFDAVEIRKPAGAEIFSGSYRTADQILVPEMTCVLGSDSHDLKSIGRESTWVLCSSAEFGQIREAMKHRDRVRFNPPETRYPRLLQLNIDGAFLGQQSFNFSAGATAFIGSKGSGKTGVLELARFALGYPSAVDDKYRAHLLGPAGRVSLSVESKDGEQFLFMRGTDDAAPHVFATNGDQVERDAVIPAILSVEIRGWGETTKLAVEVDEQLKLVDNFDTTGTIRRSSQNIQKAHTDASQVYRALRVLVAKYRDIRIETQRLEIRETTLRTLDAKKFSETQTAKETRDSETAALRQLLTQLEARKDKLKLPILPSATESLLTAITQKSFASAPGESAAIGNAVQALRTTQHQIDTAATGAIDSAIATVADSLERIAVHNEPLDAEYQRKFSELSVEEQTILSERNNVIQEIAGLPAKRVERDELWQLTREQLDQLAADLGSIANELNIRSRTRATLVSSINEMLSRAAIGTRIEFSPLARVVGSLPFGATPDSAFAGLATRYREMNEATAVRDIGLNSTIESTVTELGFEVDDGTSIQFEIYPGSWKSSSDLSAGQKSTAVLPLLLATAPGPIVLDQPEDNLDNRYIGSAVVRMIRERKYVNQLIFTTHSASIVVMSDCELIIEMADDANRGRAKNAGFLAGPDSPIAGSVLDILDGGKQALLARFKKYGRLAAEEGLAD
jgi:hypothetical protein